MTINQFFNRHTKILIFQKRIMFDPSGDVKNKRNEIMIGNRTREMSHSMPGDNKSLEIKHLSNLLPIDWDELNHVNSLEAGCKLRQTSTRAKSFFNDSYSYSHIHNISTKFTKNIIIAIKSPSDNDCRGIWMAPFI